VKNSSTKYTIVHVKYIDIVIGMPGVRVRQLRLYLRPYTFNHSNSFNKILTPNKHINWFPLHKIQTPK